MRRREIRIGVFKEDEEITVEYDLSFSELWQMIKASILSSIIGKRPVDYMTEELEELLCGYNPLRHKIVL